MLPEMPKAYEPTLVEPRWYAFWLEQGVFRASDDPKDARPVYSLPMPPPNVTGALHMGHALMTTIEDVLTRWHRMRGFNTLWTPGVDHAGISTQVVVERQLKREGLSRHDLGRAKFVERVWQWKAESGGRIALQQRELGASPDWDRSKFTMDPDMARAVTEAFVRLRDAHRAGVEANHARREARLDRLVHKEKARFFRTARPLVRAAAVEVGLHHAEVDVQHAERLRTIDE